MLRINSLRRRRIRYQISAAFGFSGYRIGSRQHAFQCFVTLAPLRRADGRGKVTAVFVVFLISGLASTLAGIDGAWPTALAVTATIWLLTGLVLFLSGRFNRGGAEPPTSGVREPRRPLPAQDGPRAAHTAETSE